MGFRTYYTINTESRSIENVGSFEQDGEFCKIKYYPNVRHMTGDVLHIQPETKYIPMESIVNIDQHEYRV